MKRITTALFAGVFLGSICLLALPAVRTDDSNDDKRPVTFTKDVAPILYRNCVQCHRPGEIAPMSLISYKEVRPWARSIKEKVVSRVMPPWHADPSYGEFANDRRLSEREVATIAAWVDQGAKEGDARDLPSVPQFPDGWNIGKPDAVFYLPKENTVPASGVVDYQYFSVPTNLKEDVWVQAAEIRPGSRGVVHHVIVFIQNGVDRKVLVGYAPGEQPAVIPRGLARRIPAGSNLVFQVHYTPNGIETKDRSYVGLVFAKEPPKNEILTRPIMNARFTIPAGDQNYKVQSSYTFTDDAHVQSLMPHMHLRGKDFEFRITYADGSSKVILSVPKYDFSWQSYYVLKEPLAAPKGARIDCTAHFDNSPGNKYNPDPTKEVRWGDQTWEEMMIGWMSYTMDKGIAKRPPQEVVGQNKQ
jgi:mono/diheme cytochrome c family protein